jgi:Undecaprenyl-phosphate galactose phosphotransferase WbaP
LKKHKLYNRARSVIEVLLLGVTDVAWLVSVFLLALYIRTQILPMVYSDFPADPPLKRIGNLIWVLLVWLFFFYYQNLYSKRFSVWDEMEALVKASFFSTAAIFAIISIGKLGDEISRTLVVVMGVLAMAVIPFLRVTTKRMLRSLGFLRRKVLILGATDAGRLVASALRKESNYGYSVVGFLDDSPEKAGSLIDGIKVHRGIDKAISYIRRANITDLFIAIGSAQRERIASLVNDLQHKVDRLLLVPDTYGVAVLETTLVHFFHQQILAFEIQNNLSRPFNAVIKRSFDLLASGLLILLLSVPMVILVGLIRIDSRGPIFYRHSRVGRRGKPFGCMKFRTMHRDADKKLADLLENNPQIRREWEEARKLKNDPRVTRVGHFLRRTSLDELPQLLNVLAGDMSLVGPRPVVQAEIDQYYKDMAKLCFSVHPGITGLWQVSGRNDTGYEERVALDSWYVKNWNLWLDVMILMKTVGAVLKREGAY